jgi:hypothetical protein
MSETGLDSVRVQCPYCWENLMVEVDRSADRQEYVEDCHICCRPIVFQVAVEETKKAVVIARKENE